ncbi:hypothetical protein TrST_g3360 [Triparma strigata]|uniref:Rieske domain-containing protein n=1 Tax=Triparma strigata TaxID=1606541 RepID=A0A9W7BQQ8_9STRA|nr:hypothetical protein TrST_g3360 [Triparma strigata]
MNPELHLVATIMFMSALLSFSSAFQFNQITTQTTSSTTSSTTLFGTRRRSTNKPKKNKDILPSDDGFPNPQIKGPELLPKSANKGRGLEVTGVTLPTADSPITGWIVGTDTKVAVANINDVYYGLQGACPRCGFDLFRGTATTSPNPKISCPTCRTSYNAASGQPDGELKGDFTSNLARLATTDKSKNAAKAFSITVKDGRVFVRDR